MSKISNWMAKKYVGLKQRQEEAQGLAEYALILALVSIACVIALTALAGGINGVLGDVVAAF